MAGNVTAGNEDLGIDGPSCLKSKWFLSKAVSKAVSEVDFHNGSTLVRPIAMSVGE